MAEEEKLSLEIVAPEKMVMTKKVDMVTISGAEGDFGVLPGHAALVSSIRPGFLEIEDNKEIEKLFIAGGFIEVLEDKVSILATEVLSSEQIDVSECEEKISKYNSEIVFGLVIRDFSEGSLKYRICFEKPEDEIYSKDIGVHISSLNRSLERLVMKAPEQYQWSYKRYKRLNKSEKNIYRRQ